MGKIGEDEEDEYDEEDEEDGGEDEESGHGSATLSAGAKIWKNDQVPSINYDWKDIWIHWCEQIINYGIFY